MMYIHYIYFHGEILKVSTNFDEERKKNILYLYLKGKYHQHLCVYKCCPKILRAVN